MGPGTHVAVKAFMENGIDWVVEDNLSDLVAGMNRLAPEGSPTIEEAHLRKVLEDRDSQLDNPFSKDAQVNYIRVAPPHRILDESKGPLIAVRLSFLTRKTLGGLETNLDGQCLNADGTVFPGLYACGEASGFGGGGMHGKNALEGTFLGGCIHSGKRVGEALART